MSLHVLSVLQKSCWLALTFHTDLLSNQSRLIGVGFIDGHIPCSRVGYVIVERKSMGGEMSFRPLVRPHRSFTSLFSHPGDKF
jgi:hypothetical protein